MIANSNSIKFLRIIFDFIILNVSFALAASLAQSLELLINNNLMFVLLLILNITWFFSASLINMYDESNFQYFSNDLINVLKNSTIQVLVSVFFLFIIKENLFTRFFILYYFSILVLFISIKKIIFRKVLKYLRKQNYNTRNVLIIGVNDIGKSFTNTIEHNYDAGYKLAGYLDDYTENIENYKGKVDCLEEVLANNRIDEVVVALPYSEFNRIDDIIKICNRNAVRTHIIPDYFRYVSRRFRISMFNNVPIITVRNEPLAEFKFRLTKRVFDIVVSALFLTLIFSWLLPVIAVIQKLTSKGTVFFIQKRVGMRNKIFNCFKFRTMYTPDCDDKEAKAIEKSDSRVTRFGRILRKTNLDEIPQFINVILGNMSVVGPRPNAISFNEVYNEYIDELKLRNIVKPGITGWAQVHGLRGDSPNPEENKKLIRQRFEYDLWYIENWSIWLDLQIVLMTVWQMILKDTKGY